MHFGDLPVLGGGHPVIGHLLAAAGLLEAVVGAALRSSNHNTRREALENLESLAAACNNLTHMLLVRDLRKLTGEE